MTNRELLSEIFETAEQLQRHADSGGNEEMAFDLTADSDELAQVEGLLRAHRERIERELRTAT